MKEELLKDIAKLRIAVGYMIEKQEWWDSKFFEPSSNDFLEYTFPKSIKKNTAFFLEPIRHSIDEEVGANYYHLFRLPVELEEQLHKSVFSNDEPINNEETAFKVLLQSSDSLSVERSEGPLNVGTSDKLNADTIQVIAAHYYSAFTNNYKVHPYLI